MGHSRAAKAESHERIVKVASERFRERGVDGIGMADLMKEAGLTPGGFYKHFASRADLVTEAIEHALRDGSAVADNIAANPKATIGWLIDGYLSLAHRDAIAASCAVTTLAGDVVRSGERARSAYAAQVNRYAELIGKLITALPARKKRAPALAALATLVGATAMARAVNDEKLSREILRSAAADLKARLD
jgi:TetR/AcrR family transcriptional repressor of nem operon